MSKDKEITDPTPNPNNREHARIPTSLEVDYSTYTPYHIRRITNISKGGVFIRTQEIIPVGTVLDISFQLPNRSTPIKSKVKVMWTYRQPSTVNLNSSGMGVQFVEVAAKDVRDIQEFINQSIREQEE